MASPEGSSQWIFPIAALEQTPTALERSLEEEMYNRNRGIEFLFRLGTSIALHKAAIFTAATWFHRFFMRHSMEDYHRQEVAAACIFLATKTEECGRKLRDVARVYCAKSDNVDIDHVPSQGKTIDITCDMILLTEEVLLEALCFDFVVESPHADLVDLFEKHECTSKLQDYAWTIAHDSYRTPLCVLYPPKILTASAFVLAQYLAEPSNSQTLDALLEPLRAPHPNAGPFTPTSPEQKQLPHEFLMTESEMTSVRDALSILLEFYHWQATVNSMEHLHRLASIIPPTSTSARPVLYPSHSSTNGHSNTEEQTIPPPEPAPNSQPPEPPRSAAVSNGTFQRSPAKPSGRRLDLS